MNFSIREIIYRFIAPRHELSCSWGLWRRLVCGLKARGLRGTRESGAFLLGKTRHGRRHVVDFVLYDDLDPHCLDTGIVHFNGQYFGALWELCKARGLTVVADIHTHPGGSQQSDSDRAHPMIARAGHLALILPRFALTRLTRAEVGMYRYEGSGQWYSIPRQLRRRFFHIGL